MDSKGCTCLVRCQRACFKTISAELVGTQVRSVSMTYWVAEQVVWLLKQIEKRSIRDNFLLLREVLEKKVCGRSNTVE